MYAKKANNKSKMFTKSKYSKKAKKMVDVRKIVKSELHKLSELQISPSVTVDQGGLTTFNTTTSALPTVVNPIDVLSLIVQGSGQGQRQGNEIQLKHLWVKLLLNSPSTPNINLSGRIVIARLKAGILAPTLGSFNALYQDGNSTDSITNSVFQNFLPFNKNVWDIKRQFRFNMNNITAYVQPFTDGGQYKFINVDVAKYLPKKIQYNDGTATPTNAGLYMFMLAGQTDTGLGPVSSYFLVNNMSMWAEYYDL